MRNRYCGARLLPRRSLLAMCMADAALSSSDPDNGAQGEQDRGTTGQRITKSDPPPPSLFLLPLLLVLGPLP